MHGHEVYGEGLDIWYFQEFDIWNHWYLVFDIIESDECYCGRDLMSIVFAVQDERKSFVE